MRAFSFSSAPLEPGRYRDAMEDPAAGGYASFEGWVRDHNEGRTVQRLEYEAFETLAIKEGERIVTASDRSRSVTSPSGSASARRTAARRSRPAATSSTR